MDVLKQFKSDCIDKLFEDFKPDNDYSFNETFLRMAKEEMLKDPSSLYFNYLYKAKNEYVAYNAFRDYELAEKMFMPNAQDLLLFTSEEVFTHGGEWVSNVLEGGISTILGNAYAEFTDQLLGFTYGVDESKLYGKVLEDYAPEKSVEFIKQIGDDHRELGFSESEFNNLANHIVFDYIPWKLADHLDMVEELCHSIKSDRLLSYMLSNMLYVDDDVHYTIEAELYKNQYLANTDNDRVKAQAKEIFTKYNIAPDWPENTPIEGKKSINIPNDRDDRPKRGMGM
ncbi:hypothetical protein [Porphyromonas somerae]|uniref:hypothetical protein n=1 Tax=Porphyromonas somerae TaxID=322095 RepID=UPI000367A3BE|nr:hypothetical protein [Porphyromonas somerae]